MEKDSNPTGACKKFYRTVTVCPAFKAIRRISYGSRPASPATNTSSPTLPAKTVHVHVQSTQDSRKHKKSSEGTKTHHTPEATGMIPIAFDYSSHPPQHEKPKSATPPQSIQKHAQVLPKTEPKTTTTSKLVVQSHGLGTKTGPKTELPQFERGEGKKSVLHIEDRFTEYINRAKIKIRTTSNIGEGKKASANDKFTDYIRRTGAKIRTTSSIGGGGSGGKSYSFK